MDAVLDESAVRLIEGFEAYMADPEVEQGAIGKGFAGGGLSAFDLFELVDGRRFAVVAAADPLGEQPLFHRIAQRFFPASMSCVRSFVKAEIVWRTEGETISDGDPNAG